MVPMPADAEQLAEPPGAGSAGYWYPLAAEVAAGDAAEDPAAVEVLRAVRRFRAADGAMRLRARSDMDLNDSDLVALRHLISAEERSEPIGPKDLSVFLGITSAATAKLLSRLESSGRLRREPHPSDRRAQVLHATRRAQNEIRRVLGAAHDRMMLAAERLSAAERIAVVRFLDELSGAMAEPESTAGPDATSPGPERPRGTLDQ
jgi:DNA-binding MarR family transcriptional regulator